MPLYDYKCADHGLFHELATMEKSAMPCACPQCGKASPRVILIPPEVLAMAPNKRQAMARNERARHEPQFSTPEVRQEKALIHSHSKNCGCDSHNPDRSSLRKQVIYMADGSKVFPSQRPWMISH